LRRFSISCYGKQKTLEDIRIEKSKQYKKLKTKKRSKEYDKWFLRYDPQTNVKNKVIDKNKKTKEDIINEAKLALEAKAITSKAVINELEKINKMSGDSKKRSSTLRSSASIRKTVKSVSSTGYLSEVLNKVKNNKTKKKPNLSIKDIFIIQNEFTPSNISSSLTDENMYK
jgi:hypothetical protein